MKILHLDFDDLDSPLGGGQAKRTFEINRRLSHRHEITVVTSRYPGSCNEVKEGVRYVRIGRESFPWNFLAWFASLPRVIRHHDFDLVVEDFTVPISTAFTLLFTRKPVVASVQNLHARPLSYKYKFPFFLIERIGCRFYRSFIVPTRSVRDQVLSYNRQAKVQIIPYGVDKELFEIDPMEEDFILFLGRIDIYGKGLDLLLNAFQQVAPGVDTRLIIAGHGRDVPRLQAMINERRLTSKVQYVGKVMGFAKTQLLSRCKFVCMSSRYETFGIVAAEAMASQKPLVVFDIPALREVALQKCAILVPCFSEEAYAEAVLTLLHDHSRRHEMGIEARKWARQFDWDEVARQQESFYYQALG